MRHFLSNEERIKSRAEGEAEGILIGIAISVSNPYAHHEHLTG